MLKKAIKKILPFWLVSVYHLMLAFLGAVICGFPSKKIKVIGITGTNGKSTVIDLMSKILEEEGFSVAAISSIYFKAGEEERKNNLRMTMPGRFTIQKFLREAVQKGCRYALLEVTSEGIKQHRHRFIDFEAAVFTNLSPEHIEAHGSFEKYKEAKGKFFKRVRKTHIINLDDENSQYFLSFPAQQKFGYTLAENVPHREGINILAARDTKTTEKGVSFQIREEHFELGLLGRFNIYNAAAAISLALSQDVDFGVCKKALAKIKSIPGRMELVVEEPFKVVVDYAFTPKALEKVYDGLLRDFSPKRLICVLGACGGGRDKWKRPVLGKIAADRCDVVFVTNEDPYDEDPLNIINQVAQGAGLKAEKISDRRMAIRKALGKARPGDVVIITGKGCEPCIIERGRRIPWDDRTVVREEANNFR